MDIPESELGSIARKVAEQIAAVARYAPNESPKPDVIIKGVLEQRLKEEQLAADYAGYLEMMKEFNATGKPHSFKDFRLSGGADGPGVRSYYRHLVKLGIRMGDTVMYLEKAYTVVGAARDCKVFLSEAEGGERSGGTSPFMLEKVKP